MFDDMFRVNLFRKVISVKTSEKRRNNVGSDLSNTQKKILELLSQDAQLSAKKIAAKNGYWEIMK